MSEVFFPRLCGGTFFLLLTRAMKPHGRVRDTFRGISGITEADLLKALIRVFYQSYPKLAVSTEKANASYYKRCENIGGSSNPMTDPVLLDGYLQLLIKQYDTVLKSMDALIDEYIDVKDHGEWLVRAILELIREDQSIPDEAQFLILPGGGPVVKRMLGSKESFYLQPFLLGVWTWIVQNRPDNTVGKPTYQAWHPDADKVEKGSRPVFVSRIGHGYGRPVSVFLFPIKKEETKDAKTEDLTHLLSGEYAEYIAVAKRKYERIKTIMDEAPKPFYDFYVCNGLSMGQFKISDDRRKKYTQLIFATGSDVFPEKTPTVDTLRDLADFIIIEGTGGLGKSMMMRHLLLNALDRVDVIGRLPVYVTLKDYSLSYPELADFIFHQFSALCPGVQRSQFTDELARGRFVLLLDGLDEIKSACQEQFDRALASFVDTWSQNMVVISSRPIGRFTRYERFAEMKLLPLSKELALQLVDKLVFRPDEPEFKQKFKEALSQRLYDSHREFASNPLLLTFMLMTFERFGEVPTQMHIFYSEVYDLLSKRHDASKVGFTRTFRSRLTPDRLKDIFAAFCATTYMDQKYQFSQTEMEDCFRGIISRSRVETERNILPADLVRDVTTGVCMMIQEGETYYFMHRSFQEYFCALSFSKQMDENLEDIGEFFERYGQNMAGDRTFAMLYDMIPDRVEKFILIPFLEKLLKRADSPEGYWDFVRRAYPQIEYTSGKTDDYGNRTRVGSLMIHFLLEKTDLDGTIGSDVLPVREDFVEAVYVKDPEFEYLQLYSRKEVAWLEENRTEEDRWEIAGRALSVDTETILNHPEQYRDFIEIMEREDFLFMKQYEGLKRLLSELKEKHRKPGKNLVSVI